MSATPNKPGNGPAKRASAGPAQNSGSSMANRSPSRLAGSGTNSTASAAAGVNRTRSVRGAGPRQAAAARKPQTDSDLAIEEVKAEMQAKLDEMQERLQQAEQTAADSRKQAAVLQHRLDEALKEQGLLDDSVHEHTERIEELENQKKESLRARRELEQIYEAERVQTMKEREEAAQREAELQSAMQRMKESLAQREIRAGVDEARPGVSRSSSFRSNNTSPNPDAGSGQFAPSSVQRSDSRNRSKLVMQKDKVIEDLRLELAEAQMRIVEIENMGGGQLLKLQKEVYDIKMQNARLMEENESFQLLLSEKTLNGDFSNSELLRPHSHAESRPPSRQPDSERGPSLADELAGESDSLEADSHGNEQARKLQGEVNSLKDQNRALTLYINNIISRLLQHDAFEAILDKTPDLMAGPNAAGAKYREKELPPPPPAEKDSEEQPQGFLKRARSVMGGRRPRPISQAVSSSDQDKLQAQIHGALKATENPDTAPRIPIGRSNSTRGSSAHRRTNSEWPAASVVTNMYKGPQGAVSPPLGSPTGVGNRNSFFAAPQPLGQRVPSGSQVPTISEISARKENQGSRDSKMSTSTSHRNSVISNGGDMLSPGDAEGVGSSSGPSSPPRSITSSGDRERGTGGAVMMGSKPRPLRLVQEAAAEDENAKKAANRSSWFGWMNKGAAMGANDRKPGGGLSEGQ